MTDSPERVDMVFETARLRVRFARPQDAEFLHRLWSEPRVMANVGFPRGLPIRLAEVRDLLARDQERETPFDRRLLVVHKTSAERLGECKLGSPDAEGVCETDVKLLPEHWGHKYGQEVKQGLVDYLFTHTDCRVVQATPNKNNAASIKMQEAVGGVRVGEKVWKAPEGDDWRTDVQAWVYQVRREDWEQLRK